MSISLRDINAALAQVSEPYKRAFPEDAAEVEALVNHKRHRGSARCRVCQYKEFLET